ncbi:thiamine biosynthesis lipoprotein [Paenarthrobacter nicotinovorans]|uniref:FAD:protein FMN transferase n=1 Tax=Micrococcaceae TaxID=1268 RepID=UPI0008770B17|nr:MULTISPECIES: FAD:protein FMN transferase [Micrococcaceae]MDR6435882.1 thiamine biosynthesis lipoprotein [Paenarthrobacter nicotinovorans]SCZ50975.1 thiamine biosynthesis lipoprotein [Arthrobacter sp. UNCCL28]
MPHPDWASFSFDGIGTRWEVSTPEALVPAVRHQLLETVSEYDRTYSRFRPDSLVSGLSRGPGRITLPGHATALHQVYDTLYRLSGGTMSPLIGSSLERLGYDPLYSLVPAGSPQAPPRWEDVLEWTGTSLAATEPVVLDVGAAGKGQLVDLLGGVLRSKGHSDFLVDGSGDMLHSGTHPVMVALEHPYNPGQAIGTVELNNSALCASASNRRAWGDGLHHVLDGTTGKPIYTTVATWTMAASALVADAAATALFMIEPARLQEEFDVAWLRVSSSGAATFSESFEGRLFS